MGNVLREGRSCKYSAEIYTNSRNDMLREFQPNRTAVDFLETSDNNANKRLYPSFGDISQISKSKELVRNSQLSKNQNLACPISNLSESSSCRLIQKNMKSKVPEQRPSSSATRYLTVLAPSSLSESSRYDHSCSLIITSYSGDEEMYFCEIERPSMGKHDRNTFTMCACSPGKIEKQVTDGEHIVPTIGVFGYNGDTCSAEASSPVRKRGKAIDLIPIERPEGKFVNEKEFFLQNAEGGWENVTIENWNPWNGTWQVKGVDGTAFPAAPIALKTAEEYGFLSRERRVRPRTFTGISETSPNSIKLSKVQVLGCNS